MPQLYYLPQTWRSIEYTTTLELQSKVVFILQMLLQYTTVVWFFLELTCDNVVCGLYEDCVIQNYTTVCQCQQGLEKEIKACEGNNLY